MEHCSYLRKYQDGTYEKSLSPFTRTNLPRYYADHVNHYGHNTSPVRIESAGYDANWRGRDFIGRTTDRLVLYYVVSGSCRLNGSPVVAGECFYTLPNEKHTIEQDETTPSRGWWLTVRGSQLGTFITRSGLIGAKKIMKLERIGRVAEIISDLVYTVHDDCDISAYMTSALYMIISMQKYEIFKENAFVGYSGNEYVARAIQYIEKNYMTDFRVSDIAAGLHISSKRLSNIFSKTAGCTVGELTAKYRIELACTLLKQDKDRSAAQIGEIVGFDDYSYFFRVFKRQTGVSPTEYRNRKSN